MICKICSQEFTNQGFTYHLTHSHNMSAKKYYDTYISKDNKCKNCGKESQFISLSKGYHKLCRDCINQSTKMICRICNKEISALGMPFHLKSQHKLNTKDYYDQFLIEGKCKVCGRPTKFHSITNGYSKTCSKQCQNEYQKSDEYLSTIYSTNLEKYGVKCALNSENAKEGMLKKYGVTNPMYSKELKEKLKQNNIEKYGVPIPNQFNNDICKEKYEEKTKSQAIKTLEKSAKTKELNSLLDQEIDNPDE